MGAYLLWEAAALHFDAVLSESVQLTAQATRHPVEQGADITDHVHEEPDRVRLDVFVSAEPIEDVNGVGASVQSTETEGGFSQDVLRFPSNFDPVRTTLATLETLKREATLIDVVTHSKYCGSMVLTDIESTPKGSGAQFKLGFESIRIVSTGTVDAPQPTQPRDVPKKSSGAQQPKPAPPPKKSAAASAWDWVTG